MRLLNVFQKHLSFSLMLLFALVVFNCQAEVTYSMLLKGEEQMIGNFLEWSTQSEIQSEVFVVEKSIDGINFEVAGFVKGAGESAQEKSYRYLDLGVNDKETFYRLKEVDLEGTTSFSHTIMIDKQLQNQFAVVSMGNTSADKEFDVTLDLTIEKAVMEYKLVSYKGQTVMEESLDLEYGINHVSVPLGDFGEGIYRLKMKVGDETENLVIRKIDPSNKKANMASKKSKSKGG